MRSSGANFLNPFSLDPSALLLLCPFPGRAFCVQQNIADEPVKSALLVPVEQPSHPRRRHPHQIIIDPNNPPRSSTTSTMAAIPTGPSGADPAVIDAINRGNVVVFFDVVLGGSEGEEDKGKPLGRIKLELFVKDVSDGRFFRDNSLLPRSVLIDSDSSILIIYALLEYQELKTRMKVRQLLT